MIPVTDRDYIAGMAAPGARVLVVGPPPDATEEEVGSLVAIKDAGWWSVPWQLEEGELEQLAAGGVLWTHIRSGEGLPVQALSVHGGGEAIT